ncbi:hypothetical protein P152DRAFT_404785 [Eremomyces bilateralis CBS 781.70]|uniref:HNH nuclease domain-containing protein n=1 Tax=Eremomyces bilateralis CBS 781.70 TaxID=1392243 RepID=A0A6G1FSS1_9PEZI|nr:uncharacterized protein P152DRAFT_404785 [Eremomyces bilateralis CBS 781.70]KAF1808731.1 hypothetical protein P152DRAFT_404785 [Eremomyces bilateralis CBS 781.70]
MPPPNRSAGRNVHIYDANDPVTVLGGLLLTPGLSNANFYSMLEILIAPTDDIIQDEPYFFVRNESDTRIDRDANMLQPGKYFIVATGRFQVNNEPWLVRTISRATGTRAAAFTEAVRSRDRRCVISGAIVHTFDGVDFWDGFEAAHIFPLAYEGDWIGHNYGRWITIPAAKGGSINSVQNGLLLDSAIHQLFDAYYMSINPDDNYKVVVFRPNSRVVGGQNLDPAYFARPDAPAASLLRWHFRQAVLANMRGAGEPVLEHDFPPGSDIVGQIRLGPKPAARMEFELFGRLSAQMELLQAREHASSH